MNMPAMDHAGIYVHRQITDEKQWARAMQAIHKEFCEDDVFVEKKWTLKEQAPPDDPMYWIKMTRAISEDDVVELRCAESHCYVSNVLSVSATYSTGETSSTQRLKACIILFKPRRCCVAGLGFGFRLRVWGLG